MKNIFIFVVCGAREHIDTLHFSLPYLQKYSKNEIWVLTDSSRNEIPVEHEHVIDIKTPEHFDHHQASIYLKTGIYQFVPKGNKYCYLDTDIIAFSKDVDLIFNEYVAPITFAPDHCTMEQFSAYAVNCDCLRQYESYREKLDQELGKVDPLRWSTDEEILKHRRELISYYETNKSILKRLKVGGRFLFSGRYFKLTRNLIYDKREKIWRERNSGKAFMHKLNLAKSSRKVGLKWNYKSNYPMFADGRSLWKNTCFHLKEFTLNKFNIKVEKTDFQHWNGGVFLFDDQSHDFLSTWFNYTMEIFKDSNWKTRDQGTLIATVWKFGLENHPTLTKKWNLIADYHNPYLNWTKDNQLQLDPKEAVKPNFIHVYHHFGDEEWDFWNQLITHVNQK